MSEASARPDRRRVIWLAAAGAILVLIVIIAIVWQNRASVTTGSPSTDPTAAASTPSASEASPSEAASSDSSPSPSKTPTPVPSASVPSATATGSPTVVPTKAVQTSEVPLDDKAELGKNVIVEVTKFETVKGTAKGPGEIAGPALRITVTVDNGSSEELPMENALVNLYYGKNKTPASTLSGPGVKPLSKPIAAGGSASGRYVFTVPKKQQRELSVEFSYTTDAPTVVFSGSR